MAAIDLPLNDSYLSHVHHVRNANKALLRAQVQAARDRQRRERFWIGDSEQADEQADQQDVTMATPATLAAARASGDQSTLNASHGLRASDSAVLSHYPTPLLRLLVLLQPVIHTAVRFVHLATWTGGPGSASHSFMLVIGWWAVCLYGYEVVRYCPQLIVLGLLVITGVGRAFKVTQRGAASPSADPYPNAHLASAATVNSTIDNLAVLADFFSSLYASLVAPLTSLLCWHDVEQTFGLAVFLLASWPVWLLLFSGTLAQIWDVLHLSSLISNPVVGHLTQRIITLQPIVKAKALFWLLSLRSKYPALGPHIDKAITVFVKVSAFAQVHVWPQVHAFSSFLSNNAPDVLRLSAGPHFGFFPLLSLRVRHLLLVIGTVALTWCSPWCALIRHALWRSALVRRSVRLTWSLLSGQIFFGTRAGSSQYGHGRLTLGPNGEPVALGALIEDEKDVFFGADSSSGALSKASKSANVTRHEDVVYQFTIFENQRWWMGLDWTAALLPQERPSWADESNNPISPPSSFSLPPPKITLKASSSDGKTVTKRVVRWQWIDHEWTVAGRDTIAGAGNEAKSISRRESSTSAAASVVSSSGETDSALQSTHLLADPSWLDVDAEGWQYGDNSWEKMSKKSGMGRYTRRRRWIRRAVLVELVQSDYKPTAEERSTLYSSAAGTAGADEHSTNAPIAAGNPTPSTSDTNGVRQRIPGKANGA